MYLNMCIRLLLSASNHWCIYQADLYENENRTGLEYKL